MMKILKEENQVIDDFHSTFNLYTKKILEKEEVG